MAGIKKKYIVVDSVADNENSGDGLTTLREALLQIQAGNAQEYEIIFSSSNDSQKPSNKLNLSYWTIELEKPLPHIISPANIYVNRIAPKNVNIIPKNLAKGKMAGVESGSTLVIGNKGVESSDPRKNPYVHLNRVNFSLFQAKGLNGVDGGGGGLGAGAAIVLRSGRLIIENSVFVVITIF